MVIIILGMLHLEGKNNYLKEVQNRNSRQVSALVI